MRSVERVAKITVNLVQQINNQKNNLMSVQTSRTKEISKLLARVEGTEELECRPMPNVMAALPNIGGALCSIPQSLANAHYWSDVQ